MVDSDFCVLFIIDFLNFQFCIQNRPTIPLTPRSITRKANTKQKWEVILVVLEIGKHSIGANKM